MAATADELRAAMVATIRARHGVHDERVLAALASVPRHEFVDPTIPLETAYEPAIALPARGFDPGQITTTVSAPNLVAWTIQELHVQPGMAVLEIGTGSGWNAALLAELGCRVTTVEIDGTLVEPARRRLAAVGHGDVRVVHGDGDDGVPDGAPYDRIVGTVGCNDLAPAWFDQLAPDGYMLVPLRHGSLHPTVRATADRTATFLIMSGFVAVLGAQAGDVAADAEVGHHDLDRLTASFVPRGTGEGDWVVPRIHHDEVLSLR